MTALPGFLASLLWICFASSFVYAGVKSRTWRELVRHGATLFLMGSAGMLAISILGYVLGELL